MTKATPKSCSCSTCRKCRGSDAHHKRERHDERAFRHRQNEQAQQIATHAGVDADSDACSLGFVPAGVRLLAG